MKPQPLRRIRKKITIPVYGAVLHIIVSNDINKERARFNDIMGPYPVSGDIPAMVSTDNCGTVAIFFVRNVSINDIAHEVFHATMRIQQWREIHWDDDNSESFAMLNGYLMALVCETIGVEFNIKEN